ncbi:MAG: methyltransferase domain-containing protein [Minisyncoccia bacterium]
MHHKLLDYMACPECGGNLLLTTLSTEGDHIVDGLLACTMCTQWYVIRGGVPRMLPDSLLPGNGTFYKKYASQIAEAIGDERTRARIAKADDLLAHKAKTITNFGDEWRTWDRFGWKGDTYTETTKGIFDYKILFTPQEIKGKLLLDGGVGNGRYSLVARAYGAEVIGVDISAADTAYKNMKDDPGMHVIQGDLFKLPLRKKLLDFAFSNGVLMHTGDARKAFLSIASHLNDNGVISAHLYHKGNFIYEFNDWWLRLIGVYVLPLSWMYKISDVAAWLARQFPHNFLYLVVNSVVRLEPHAHYVFDWYTAPIATHHTYPEVYGWLKEGRLHLVEDHNATNHPWLRKLVPFWFLTVKAQKQPLHGEPRHTTN